MFPPIPEGLSGVMYDVLLTILDMFMLKKTSKIQQITPISFMEMIWGFFIGRTCFFFIKLDLVIIVEFNFSKTILIKGDNSILVKFISKSTLLI